MKPQNNWLPVLGSLLSTLQKAGFVLLETDNGEDRTTLTGTPRQRRQKAKAELNATDESHLYVAWQGRKLWLFIVLGNEPCETVADYTCHEELDKVLEAWSDSWEGKACPKTSNRN
jgi:hypothetical protein